VQPIVTGTAVGKRFSGGFAEFETNPLARTPAGGHRRGEGRRRLQGLAAFDRGDTGAFGEGKRRGRKRRRGPAVAARRRRFRIARGGLVAPFESVIIDQALQKAVAQIGVEAIVVAVRRVGRLAIT
jgi:hypothetical protein